MKRLGLGSATVFLFALLAVGCSTAGQAALPDVGNSLEGDRTAGEQPAEQPASDPDTSEQLADQQLIVYTGTLQVEVAELRPAMDQAEQLVRGMGGHVAASSVESDGDSEYATVTYRIPADRWAEALAGLRGVGTRVLNESTDSEDVTAQVVDIEARIENLRASEAALQEIMDRAGTIDDVLEVQRELTSVRSEIESLTAQRDLLANRAQLATLEVTFGVPIVATTVATGGWDLAQEIDNALAALVRLAQGLTSLAVWLLIVVLPVLVPVVVLLYLAVRLRRRWLANHPPQPAVAAASAATPPPGPWQGEG
jgi:hypothetical protein